MGNRTSTPHGSNDMSADASSMDAVYRALAHGYRRHVIAHLTAGTTASVTELATEISEHERDRTVEEIATTLHHHHLPLLAEADLLEYQPGTDDVALTEQGKRARQLLPPPTEG